MVVPQGHVLDGTAPHKGLHPTGRTGMDAAAEAQLAAQAVAPYVCTCPMHHGRAVVPACRQAGDGCLQQLQHSCGLSHHRLMALDATLVLGVSAPATAAQRVSTC